MSQRTTIPDDAIAAYDRVIASADGAVRKGATMPYTAINGNMSSFLSPTGVLALRLPAADRAAFIRQYDALPHEAHGRPMAEYLSVPDALLADTETLAPWFASSWRYVASLKPKSTTKDSSR